MLEKNPSKYDLILVDWDMPQMNGVEMCKRIAQNSNLDSIKTILVSAYDKEFIQKGIEEAKIDFYLQKPIKPSYFNDILSDMFLEKSIEHRALELNTTLEDEIKTLKGSHILLAEDNGVNQEVFVELLEGSGIDIDIAFNGMEVIDMYQSSKEKYELIFMDIQMPILDGYEATQKIRSHDKEIPIVALSANAMSEHIEKSKAMGMNDHLNKPIDVEKLYEVLLKFIPQKVDTRQIESIIQKSSADTLPEFNTLDKAYALELLMGNEEAFQFILKGLTQYRGIDFEKLDNEELQRAAHTLKGLSASAGALEISNIADKLESTLDRDLIATLKEALWVVINEIEDKLPTQESTQINPTQDQRDRFFMQLKEALQRKRVKNITSIIEEIEKYNLESEDKKVFEEIKALLSQFNYKKALELL